MTLEGIGPMLDELRTMLTSVGCRVTEMSVTFYPQDDEEPCGAAVEETSEPGT